MRSGCEAVGDMCMNKFIRVPQIKVHQMVSKSLMLSWRVMRAVDTIDHELRSE